MKCLKQAIAAAFFAAVLGMLNVSIVEVEAQ